jgi:hypothetical protein
MEARKHMAPVMEKLLAPAAGLPTLPTGVEAETGLNISVVFTEEKSTLAALKKAGDLAARLGAHVTLLVPQIVPYPAPLTSPPVLIEFSERHFREIASQSPVGTTVHLYLCRDPWEILLAVLPPHSLVVLGGRKRWWPSTESRLARHLQRAGHEVIFTETE